MWEAARTSGPAFRRQAQRWLRNNDERYFWIVERLHWLSLEFTPQVWQQAGPTLRAEGESLIDSVDALRQRVMGGGAGEGGREGAFALRRLQTEVS